MSYAQNKSLAEYGELNSMHHSDVQAEREAGEEQARIDSLPAFLRSHLQLGGSYIIEWSKGDAEVPTECQGLWTGATQANNAIQTCMTRLTAEAEQRQEAELEAKFEAAAAKEIITAEEETKKPVSKPVRKTTGK